MQEAALECVNAHDGAGFVTKALLHHQVAHVLLLYVYVAVLRKPVLSQHPIAALRAAVFLLNLNPEQAEITSGI